MSTIFCRIELIKYSELKHCPFGSISTILNPSGDQKTVSIRFGVEIIVFGFVVGFSLVCSHCCSKSLILSNQLSSSVRKKAHDWGLACLIMSESCFE